MHENIKKLFKEIAKDKDLATKFEGCKGVEEAYALATSVIDGYTIEEFKNVLAAAKVENGELSDSRLEGVAGGVGKILSPEYNSFWELLSNETALSIPPDWQNKQ